MAVCFMGVHSGKHKNHKEGLDRFLETQHGVHEGFQRSRSPSPTHEVRPQEELLERVRPPCLP